MKPPVVHQTVPPPGSENGEMPVDHDDEVRPAGSVAGDDGRDVRYESTEGPVPGLVGDVGPLVETLAPARDGAADDERETP